MGATPTAGQTGEDDRMVLPRRREVPNMEQRRETPAWGYLVHPSLLPTVFAPSSGAPSGDPGQEVAARKV